MKRAALVFLVLALASIGWISCGYSKSYYKPPSGLTQRVLVSQDVNSTFSAGGLRIVNGQNDTLPRVSEIPAGSTPGLMTLSPTRSTLLVFDSSSNGVQVVNTVTESNTGRIQLPGSTTSMAMATTSSFGYAAVPNAGMPPTYPAGAVVSMDLTVGSSVTIGVPSAQTVIANSNGTQLLVFSNDSDSISLIFPQLAVGPIDVGCDNIAASVACMVLPGFDRPVYGIIDGSTAYIVNCGADCGGTQASIQVVDLSVTPPALGASVNVDAATTAFLAGSTLYVAGTSITNNACTGPTTAATTCGRLDIVDLGSMTVTSRVVIPDGYHNQIDMSLNHQLFVGSKGCTNVGNVNNPSGEVRGCLAILDTTKPGNTTPVIPPDNGDVTGLQSFSSYYKEYVAEGGNLRVYDTMKDQLQINSFTPLGTITIVGQAVDVKAIDFF